MTGISEYIPAPRPEATPAQLVRAVYGATFFVRFGFGVSVSIFAAYIARQLVPGDLDTVGVIGLVSAMAPIGEFSTVLFSGLSADRFGRFPVLLAGMTGATLLLFVASSTRRPLELGAVNLLFGVSSGAILAASLAVVGDQVERDHRGLAMGRFDAMNLLGWILGFSVGFAGLGTLPNSALPWLFRLAASVLAFGIGFTVLAVYRYREPHRHASFSLRQIREAAFRRDVLLVTFPWLVIYMLIGTAFVFLGAASSGAGLPTPYLAAIIGGGGLVLLLTQPWFGRMADRFGRMRMMIIGTMGFVAVLILGSLIAQYGPKPSLLGGIGLATLFALAYGPAALAALADLSRTLTRGTTMAVYSLVISLGMIIGLVASTELFSHLGTGGLELFFGVVAFALVVLTGMRWNDLRTGRGQAVVEGTENGLKTPAQ
ncbi:MAG TPA: MFS transporter [Thermoplasmata archaeon]|nr:MFS transporter [Thermoplasmata archaeon]